jgi:O-antigen ligase
MRSGVVKRGNKVFLALALICSLAVFLSASRSALATLVGGALLLFLFDWQKIASQVKLWLVLLTPTVFIIFAQSTIFTRLFSRNGSNEGIDSSVYRADLLQWTRYFTQDYFFQGTGPGTSDNIWPSFGTNNPLENGFFQLWVSLGLIPAVVCLCFVSVLLMRQMRNNLTSLLCLLPAIAYLPLTNFVDSCSSFMSLISIFIVISLLPPGVSQNDVGGKS